MNFAFLLTLFSPFSNSAQAEGPPRLIHVKLMNGRTGKPMKHTSFAYEVAADYSNLAVITDNSGIASLSTTRDATILVENTKAYVRCADEQGGLVHNSFKVSEILTAGVVEAISAPNQCSLTSGAPVAGQLTIFVRPWRPGEQL